jgi:rsbT antagonist protein RsbS
MSDIQYVKAVISKLHQCLIVTLPSTLHSKTLSDLQESVLKQVSDLRPKGVIIDCSAVEMMDEFEFDSLKKVNSAISIMGTTCKFVSLRPWVVSSLIYLGVDTDRLPVAFDLEEALSQFSKTKSTPSK